jgi:esterase
MQLHRRELGDGPVEMVLLHGLFGSSVNLAAVARRLQSEARLHLLDLRNHGASGHADDMDLATMADDVALGHSLGGKVAMELAVRHPRLVAGLVVLDMAPRAYATADDPVLAALGRLEPAALESRAEAERQLAGWLGDETLAAFLASNLRRDEQGRLGWRIHLEAIVRHRSRLAAAVSQGCWAGPTLFLASRSAGFVVEADRSDILARFPAARLQWLAGVGHWLHAEAPEAVAAAVGGFVREVAVAAAPEPPLGV